MSGGEGDDGRYLPAVHEISGQEAFAIENSRLPDRIEAQAMTLIGSRAIPIGSERWVAVDQWDTADNQKTIGIVDRMRQRIGSLEGEGGADPPAQLQSGR